MKLYPSWRTNLSVFALIIVIVGGYFFRQTQRAASELQKHAQEHSEILAAVVELTIKNALLAQSVLEETVAASLENSGRFIHYLDRIEPFSSAELTAFAAESGLAGVKIIQESSGIAVSGPSGWLAGKSCSENPGLERLEEKQLYLFTSFSSSGRGENGPRGCVMVGLSAHAIDATLERISVQRLLNIFEGLYDIAYVRFAADPEIPERGADILETVVDIDGKPLIVALKTDRFGKRRKQMQHEFVVFIGFLVLFGAFSSWWLYRVQHQRLQQTRDFERKMARQREDAALGRAAATITHELKNPLNAIGMGLQRLQIEAEGLEGDHEQLIVSMRSAVDRSDRILSRLRQSIHSMEVSRESCDLVELVNQVLTLYRPQCEEQNVSVEFEHDETVCVNGDRVLLGQLFENLLKNGVEAQGSGGFLSVSMSCARKKGYCQVTICNGGFFLNREESRLLFEPYFTSKSKGTGLGLVISARIVKAHGGTLDWEADFREQTICFVLSLPLT